MKLIKKITAVAAAAVTALSLAACGQAPSQSGKISVICTVFPIYDWTVNIAGENADVTLLNDRGTDMHSFEPSAADLAAIADCDVFIYIGGESDKWVTKALTLSGNKKRQVINLSLLLGDELIKEQHTEGMTDTGHGEEEPEDDEHIWLSLKNSAYLCGEIAKTLENADPPHADSYSANAEDYISRLVSLDGEYSAVAKKSKHKTLVIADRFPFAYLFHDLGLSYYAAFPGCSAETGASFYTVAFLAKKTDELGLDTVITTENPVKGIADAVIGNTASGHKRVSVLDSMQSVTVKQIENGASYIGIAKRNLEVLKCVF